MCYFWHMNPSIEQLLENHFPTILDTELVEGIKEHASYVEVEEGDLLMDIGGKISTIPMIISDQLR